MQIRPLQPADLDLLGEIDATIDASHYLHVDRAAEGLSAQFKIEERPLTTRRVESNPIADDLRFMFKQFATGIEDGLAMVAEHDALPIGSILARQVPGSKLLEIVDVRVDFDRRREGLGSALLFQAINYARDQECRAIRADAVTSNAPFNRLLSKLGFEVAGIDTFRTSNHDLVKEQTTLIWYLPLE